MDQSLLPWFEPLQEFDVLVDLGIDEVVVGETRFEKVQVQARLDDGRLVVEQANLQSGEQELSVTGRLDTSQDCPGLEVEMQLDRFDTRWLESLAHQVFDAGGRAERIQGRWQSCGATLAEHRDSANLGFRAEGLTVSRAGQTLPLAADRIEGHLAWLGAGQISLDGTVHGERLSGELRFGPLETLLSGRDWNVEVEASAAEATLQLAGQLARDGQDAVPNFDLSFELEAEQFDRLAQLVEVDIGYELPVYLKARIKRDGGRYHLEIEPSRLGRSDVAGQIEWAGAENGQAVRARLRSNILALDQLTKVATGKQVSRPDDAEAPIEGQESGGVMPPVELEWQAERILSNSLEAEDVAFSGTYHDLGVHAARLRLSIEDTPIEGEFDVDLGKEPAELAFDFNLDEPDFGALFSALGITDRVDVSARSAGIHVETRGATVSEWVKYAWAEAVFHQLEWRNGSDQEPGGQRLKMETARLDLDPDANSTLSGDGTLDGVPMRIWLEIPAIETVLDTARPMAFRAALGTNAEITLLQGRLDRSKSEAMHADLALSVELLDGPEVPDYSRLVSPRKDLYLETTLNLEQGRALAESLTLLVGGSRIDGSVELRTSSGRLAVEAALTSPFIETEDLVPFVARWQEAAAAQEADNPDDVISREGSSIIVALDRKLETLQTVDFNIQAEAKELRSAGELLGRGKLAASGAEDRFDFELETRGVEGAITASYHSQPAADGWEMNLDVKADQLEFGGLMRLLNPESTATGELFLDTSLSSRFRDGQDVLDGLQGQFDLLALPREVGAAWLDIWASNLLFALLSFGDESQKKMNCMVARFEVEDGVMRSQNTFLDTTEIIVRARGDIDLAGQNLDLLIAPQAKLERFLSVQTPVKVTGPLNDFQVDMAPGGFMTTMIRWYYGLIYVPWKWLTGQKFPADGLATCYDAMDWPVPGEDS